MRKTGIAVTIALLVAMTAGAGVIFDTLPQNQRFSLTAPCGQTWMTGTLGLDKNLHSIEVETRSDGGGGGTAFLAVYKNNAASGSAAAWVLGDFVGVSVDSYDMGAVGALHTFNFSGEELSDSTRYLYIFVDAGLNPVNAGIGLKTGVGTAEQRAYRNGGVFSSFTIASRITTGVGLPPPTLDLKIFVK